MGLHKVVIAVVKRNRSFEVFQLFAESIRKTAQSAAVHPKGMILFLDVARGDQINDRASCMRSMLRILLPSQSMDTAIVFFSVLS